MEGIGQVVESYEIWNLISDKLFPSYSHILIRKDMKIPIN